MKRYIDLTGKLENGLWSYRVLPGLESLIPPVSIQTIASVMENGFFASKISFSTISGTYVESGSHILDNGKMLDEYHIEDFIKPANIIHLPVQKPRALIDETLLKSHAPAGNFKGEALLIDTGWGKNWNREGYVLECPNFTRGAIEWVISRGISMFGVDVPCIEGAWSEDVAEEKGGLLSMLFKSDILLVAPLINLEKVKGNMGILYALPLYVAGTSGAPARVVFEEEA
ncbi:MAG: cyclase family protein [Spirochaetota bacterium]